MKFRIIVFLLLNSLFSPAFAAEKKQRVETKQVVREPKDGHRYVLLTNDEKYFIRFNSEAKGPHDMLEVVPRGTQSLHSLMQDPATHFRFIRKGGSYQILAQDQKYLSARAEKEKPEDKSWPVSLVAESKEWEEFGVVQEQDGAPLAGVALRSRHNHYLSVAQLQDQMFVKQRDGIGEGEHLLLFEVPSNLKIGSSARRRVMPILADGLPKLSMDLVGEVADFLAEPGPWADYSVSLNQRHGFSLSSPLIERTWPPQPWCSNPEPLSHDEVRAINDVKALMSKWVYETTDLRFSYLLGGDRISHFYLVPPSSFPSAFKTPAWNAWKTEMASILPGFKEKIEAEELKIEAEELKIRKAKWPVVREDGSGKIAYATKAEAEAAGVIFLDRMGRSGRSVKDGELVLVFSEVCEQ